MNSTARHTLQRRIQPLPTHLANQIAAGEVVERPASVVKELLENSIDAGARHIELEVEQGGLKLIRVLDDGAGIHPEDLPLATSPHATSKVYSQQELQQVLSLGFRGEALASIASVSRFSLASRQPSMEQGLRLAPPAGGRSAEAIPCAMPPGTRIEVRELFYNIPARRKFLRSERTEYLHLEEVLKRLALSRYDIGFKLLHNGRQQFNLTPVDAPELRGQRVSAVLGKSFLQHALGVEFEAAGMRLWGWVGEPGYSRSQADAQYFYLNGRMIRDKLVSHALRQAHQSVLELGRYPAYLLYLEIDPQQVDINVHPTKHEVRFRESRLVHDFLLRALVRALSGSAEALPLREEPGPAAQSESHYPGGRRSEPARVAEQVAFYRQPLTPAARPTPVSATVSHHSRLLAVAHGGYLLLQRSGEVGVLAVAAARQLLLSRRLGECLASGEVQSQPLLIPATVRLATGQIEGLEQQATTLLRLGVVVERLGEEAVVLRQLPLLLRGVEPQRLIIALCEFFAMAPDVESERHSFLQGIAGQLAPLLPSPDMATGEVLLRELEQLISDGALAEEELPWLPLNEERLAALFATSP